MCRQLSEQSVHTKKPEERLQVTVKDDAPQIVEKRKGRPSPLKGSAQAQICRFGYVRAHIACQVYSFRSRSKI